MGCVYRVIISIDYIMKRGVNGVIFLSWLKAWSREVGWEFIKERESERMRCES